MSMADVFMFNDAYVTEQIAYKLGAEDMREAIHTLYNAINDDMTCSTMKELFNTIYIRNIVEDNAAIDIITKIKHWKEVKKQIEELNDFNFKVGDEIICANPCYTNYGKKYVVVETSFNDEKNKYMQIISLSTLTSSYTLHIDFYRKTGKHYDSIPIPKEGGEEE